MTTYATLKETSDQDLAVENGDLVLIEDENVVKQQLETNYRFSKNDWFLDLDEGIRYFDNEDGIIGNKPLSEQNRSDLITTGSNTVGVKELTSIEFNFDSSGELSVPITAVTEFATEIETTITI